MYGNLTIWQGALPPNASPKTDKIRLQPLQSKLSTRKSADVCRGAMTHHFAFGLKLLPCFGIGGWERAAAKSLNVWGAALNIEGLDPNLIRTRTLSMLIITVPMPLPTTIRWRFACHFCRSTFRMAKLESHGFAALERLRGARDFTKHPVLIIGMTL